MVAHPAVRKAGLVVFMMALLGLGCATTPDRLLSLERRFYELLEDPAERDRFLQLDRVDREPFLRSTDLWEHWIALSPQERDAVERGEVQLGFHEFAVYMAWGPPADTQVREVNAIKTAIHTFIRCTSGPRRGRFVRTTPDCDGTTEERRVTIRNGIVVEKIAS